MEKLMIRHYCDECGIEVTESNGLIGDHELTIERKDGKVSMNISISNMFFNRSEDEPSAAICKPCVKNRIDEWTLGA
jgi:hypothetical protein